MKKLKNILYNLRALIPYKIVRVTTNVTKATEEKKPTSLFWKDCLGGEISRHFTFQVRYFETGKTTHLEGFKTLRRINKTSRTISLIGFAKWDKEKQSFHLRTNQGEMYLAKFTIGWEFQDIGHDEYTEGVKGMSREAAMKEAVSCY